MNEAIEITNFPNTDYMPLVDYEGWRVAVLASCANTTPEKIQTMQKHDYTDEVFVLVRGNAILITAGNGHKPEGITLHKMEPYKTYNIKKGFWHNHVLDEDGIVLIVENSNTCDENSPIMSLTNIQMEDLRRKLL